MFGVLKAGDFYIKGYVPVIRDHLNIPALYSVILDIPSATWQQSTSLLSIPICRPHPLPGSACFFFAL
jgi:hypothetical protein